MRLLIISAAFAVLTGAAHATAIERACLKSDRQAANRSLCGCIQDVANLTLSTADQRRAAAFFTNPNRAQEVRQSGARRDEQFWDRYRAFGDYAKSYCS